VDRERLSSGTRWTLAPSSSRGTQCDRRELVFWLDGDTSNPLYRRGLARPVGSEVIEIVPEPEIKAFWGLPQPSLLFYSYLTGLR